MKDFNKSYNWDLLEEVMGILEIFSETTQAVCPTKSCSLSAALASMIQVHSMLYKKIQNLGHSSKLEKPLGACYNKIDEYYDYYTTDVYLVGIGNFLNIIV